MQHDQTALGQGSLVRVRVVFCPCANRNDHAMARDCTCRSAFSVFVPCLFGQIRSRIAAAWRLFVGLRVPRVCTVDEHARHARRADMDRGPGAIDAEFPNNRPVRGVTGVAPGTESTHSTWVCRDSSVPLKTLYRTVCYPVLSLTVATPTAIEAASVGGPVATGVGPCMVPFQHFR